MKCFLVLLFLLPVVPCAQVCCYTQLSGSFDVCVQEPEPYAGSNGVDGFCLLVKLMDKNTGTCRQYIDLVSEYWLGGGFQACERGRSYSSGWNDTTPVTDNDYGDVVVADLNFDGLEDLALLHNSGGNAGPLYAFYIQDKRGFFVYDSLLTGQMFFFPAEISSEYKTLTTLARVNTYQYAETVLAWNVLTGSWEQKSRKLITYEQE